MDPLRSPPSKDSAKSPKNTTLQLESGEGFENELEIIAEKIPLPLNHTLRL